MELTFQKSTILFFQMELMTQENPRKVQSSKKVLEKSHFIFFNIFTSPHWTYIPTNSRNNIFLSELL